MIVTNKMIYQKLVQDVFRLNKDQKKKLCKKNRISECVFFQNGNHKIWIDKNCQKAIEDLYEDVITDRCSFSYLEKRKKDELEHLDIISCCQRMEEMCSFFYIDDICVEEDSKTAEAVSDIVKVILSAVVNKEEVEFGEILLRLSLHTTKEGQKLELNEHGNQLLHKYNKYKRERNTQRELLFTPIPTIEGYEPDKMLCTEISKKLSHYRVVMLEGAPGMGKYSAAAGCAKDSKYAAVVCQKWKGSLEKLIEEMPTADDDFYTLEATENYTDFRIVENSSERLKRKKENLHLSLEPVLWIIYDMDGAVPEAKIRNFCAEFQNVDIILTRNEEYTGRGLQKIHVGMPPADVYEKVFQYWTGKNPENYIRYVEILKSMANGNMYRFVVLLKLAKNDWNKVKKALEDCYSNLFPYRLFRNASEVSMEYHGEPSTKSMLNHFADCSNLGKLTQEEKEQLHQMVLVVGDSEDDDHLSDSIDADCLKNACLGSIVKSDGDWDKLLKKCVQLYLLQYHPKDRKVSFEKFLRFIFYEQGDHKLVRQLYLVLNHQNKMVFLKWSQWRQYFHMLENYYCYASEAFPDIKSYESNTDDPFYLQSRLFFRALLRILPFYYWRMCDLTLEKRCLVFLCYEAEMCQLLAAKQEIQSKCLYFQRKFKEDRKEQDSKSEHTWKLSYLTCNAFLELCFSDDEATKRCYAEIQKMYKALWVGKKMYLYERIQIIFLKLCLESRLHKKQELDKTVQALVDLFYRISNGQLDQKSAMCIHDCVLVLLFCANDYDELLHCVYQILSPCRGIDICSECLYANAAIDLLGVAVTGDFCLEQFQKYDKDLFAFEKYNYYVLAVSILLWKNPTHAVIKDVIPILDEHGYFPLSIYDQMIHMILGSGDPVLMLGKLVPYLSDMKDDIASLHIAEGIEVNQIIETMIARIQTSYCDNYGYSGLMGIVQAGVSIDSDFTEKLDRLLEEHKKQSGDNK